jgi:MinD superfamily P-loop ATPase
MKSTISRRGLFTLVARAVAPVLQPRAAVQPEEAEELLAVVQGRHCLALSSFCSVCVERCPIPGALHVFKGLPMVVPDACNGCGICHQVCPAPTNAILMRPRPPYLKKRQTQVAA